MVREVLLTMVSAYEKSIRKKGYDSLWGHSDTGMLRADEIVIYSETAVDIRYLVEVTV